MDMAEENMYIKKKKSKKAYIVNCSVLLNRPRIDSRDICVAVIK